MCILYLLFEWASLCLLSCILGLCVFFGFEHFPKFKRTLSVSSKIHAGINAFRQIEISLYTRIHCIMTCQFPWTSSGKSHCVYSDSTVLWHVSSPRIHESSPFPRLGKFHCAYSDSTVSWMPLVREYLDSTISKVSLVLKWWISH